MIARTAAALLLVAFPAGSLAPNHSTSDSPRAARASMPMAVEARAGSAPTVVLVGGLQGEDATAAAVRAAIAAYEKRKRAAGAACWPCRWPTPMAPCCSFRPTGTAYRENAESHTLWRWLGSAGAGSGADRRRGRCRSRRRAGRAAGGGHGAHSRHALDRASGLGRAAGNHRQSPKRTRHWTGAAPARRGVLAEQLAAALRPRLRRSPGTSTPSRWWRA